MDRGLDTHAIRGCIDVVYFARSTDLDTHTFISHEKQTVREVNGELVMFLHREELCEDGALM